jgi:hypothetical protein
VRRDFVRILGFTLLFVGLAWACVSVPLYHARVTATTSVSLEVLTGRESLNRDEVFTALTRHGAEMKRFGWWFVGPALVTFCGGLLLSRNSRPRSE